MMPSAPTAQLPSAPPANVLYITSNPAPDWEFSLKNFASAWPSIPGMTMKAVSRQTASSMIVNKIRDFSSGILKQLPRVLAMERNILLPDYFLAGAGDFLAMISTEPPLASIFVFAEALMALTTTTSFLFKSQVPRILMPSLGPLAKPMER